MNTPSSKIKINRQYKDLFTFTSKEDKIEHRAQMISYFILSEIENYCVEKGIKKKDLAEMIGTSRSYITQLFSGKKQINTTFLAKVEYALNIEFNFNKIVDKIDKKNSKLNKIDSTELNKSKPELAV